MSTPEIVSPPMSALEKFFLDYKARRHGILKALTEDFDRVSSDLRREYPSLLSVYGLGTGNWVLDVVSPDDLPLAPIITDPQNDDEQLRDEILFKSKDWLRQVSCYFSTKFDNIVDRDRFLALTQMFFSLYHEVGLYYMAGPYSIDPNKCQDCEEAYVDGEWILCDVCGAWYHMRCQLITREEAEKIPVFSCQKCSLKSS